jgi:hypothetical protein
MTPVLAHAGHWIANFLYVAPVAIIVVGLVIQSKRDKRTEREEEDEA